MPKQEFRTSSQLPLPILKKYWQWDSRTLPATPPDVSALERMGVRRLASSKTTAKVSHCPKRGARPDELGSAAGSVLRDVPEDWGAVRASRSEDAPPPKELRCSLDSHQCILVTDTHESPCPISKSEVSHAAPICFTDHSARGSPKWNTICKRYKSSQVLRAIQKQFCASGLRVPIA